ncbi:long-chain-fatty-acid--CoA ligase ACSBG2-like isoform X2 [Mytilus californianus]|uniref:long-chain-fatty-acid--CoA ligase ACSBG2-like isoform X2 n=1 Tax=Mytilus californianus TaxID=6549 RepID=UPI00224647D7|nr:long-chain-fatty-acid--CoA ligase ACSBG2-like isoform X2 [Mytilus californianus]
MSETDSGGVPKEAGDSSDLSSSFVTKINVTSEGAANGHVTGKVNGEVIVNGHSDSSNEANDNKEVPSTENVKVEEITQNGSVLTEEVESVSMETDEINTSKNGTDEEIRTKGDVTTEEPKTNENVTTEEPKNNDNETCEKTAAETKSNDNQTSEKINTNENLVTEENRTNTLQEIDLENKNENKNVEEIVSETKTVEITKTVQEEKEQVENDVVMQKEIYAPKPTILSVEGIDEVVLADSWSTTKRDGTVKIRMGTKGNQADQPVTLITVFKKTSERAPNHLALAVKRDSTWKKWTYQQYYADVCAAAKSFIKLGLEPYHGVGILGFNSPEWLISDLGCIFAGGFATGIYATNTPEAVEYVAMHSEANVLVVENNQQLQKILKVWPNLPCLKAVVQYTGEVAERKDNVYSWDEFMKVGQDVTDEQLQERINLAKPNKCCTLIYTSGTTGDPKGVMLSHDNATWVAVAIAKLFKFVFGSEVIISYLPLSHIAAQMMDILIPVTMASAVYFAQPDALKGSLLGTLQEVRPTGFFGVPRVWEKFYEGIKAKARSSGALKKKIGMWAKGVGLKGSLALMNKQSMPFGWGLANTLVFKKARTALGLDRCRFFMSGAAPIMKETLEFFYSLNMQLHEVYGMSESTGPHTVGCNEDFKICSVGHNFPGSETKLANPDEDGNGEICMWGRHVFMGYLNAPEKNKEVFDEEHWLKTGDLGKHDEQGFLFITGRIKELIITAGGENIAPVPMEDAVKEALPCINNCMLIGDKRKFLSMILCLKVDINPDTAEPSNNLTTDCKDWCKSIGSEATTVEDIIDKKDAVVLKAIQDGIDRANAKSVSRAAKVQKWSIIPRDFSIPGGELGPTLKLRRPVVTKMYKKTIDAFYTEAEDK